MDEGLDLEEPDLSHEFVKLRGGFVGHVVGNVGGDLPPLCIQVSHIFSSEKAHSEKRVDGITGLLNLKST